MTEKGKLKTITELVKELEPVLESRERILLQSSGAVNTYFTPLEHIGKYWYGWERWYGNNHKQILNKKKGANGKIWKFVKKVPKLPKNHPIRNKIKYNE